jgi:hypothetical protein
MRKCLCLLLVCCVASAQDFVSSGGRWVRTAHTDSMTDKPSVGLHLFADHSDSDEAHSTHLTIHCSGVGNLTGVRLYPDEILAVPDVIGGYSSASAVQVRIDEKVTTEGLTIDSEGTKGPFHLSNSLLKKILQAKEVRFRYSVYPDIARTVTFHPAGIDRSVLAKDCGLSIPGETSPSVPLNEAIGKE